MKIGSDYLERVYSGVLGKIIGVYLGRPFEGWTHDRIMSELGQIRYYVHQRLNRPLIVTDDDISGTLTFLRALPDNGNRADLSAAEIGRGWLNYLVEEKTVLWWGGLGNSTEHTAYLRLKEGIEAPRSGSIELNGPLVAQQIGAQIFIDGWAMVAPGDPELAARLAGEAAAVSHDGEAIHGAKVLAAMEALAFVEPNLEVLFDEALRLIPDDCIIARMIGEIRAIHAGEREWRAAWRSFSDRYNYQTYPGNCHMVPNHGVIVLGLLYGEDDFQQTLSIVNSCGWDTDCNSGNAGCLLGIKNGLEGVDAGPDWRGPVADRLFVSSADGGRAVSDALTEAYRIAASGFALAGKQLEPPKEGARFHFSQPGSVQGFLVDDSTDCSGALWLENAVAPTGERSLALHYHHLGLAHPARAGVAVFIPPEALNLPGYGFQACPSLYPGQTVHARILSDPGDKTTVECRLYAKAYGMSAAPILLRGERRPVVAGAVVDFSWRLPSAGGAPLYEVGVEIEGERGAAGTLYLDRLGWEGEPEVDLVPQDDGGGLWRRAWVEGVDGFRSQGGDPYRVFQNQGTGLLIQGAPDWRDVTVATRLTVYMARRAGVAIRVQGLRRYYALMVCEDGFIRLARRRDEESVTLAEAAMKWAGGATLEFFLSASGGRLRGSVNGQNLEADNDDLQSGAIALVCDEGTIGTSAVLVRPAE
jgi:ADP-ribosylglycohydrolase